uniref:Uncharacterized protein n=1 Tax=Oryza sativa subsp. japonica TaxID=39947 RepID=Q69L92_ORYSJ|nr:hypothetical protein [Oryza sativa Japonica Group]
MTTTNRMLATKPRGDGKGREQGPSRQRLQGGHYAFCTTIARLTRMGFHPERHAREGKPPQSFTTRTVSASLQLYHSSAPPPASAALGTIAPSSRSPRRWPPTAADATRAGLAQSSVPPCRPCSATHAGLPQSSSPLMPASRCHCRHPLHLSPSVPSHVGYLTLAKSVVETSDLATGTLHQATAALDQQPHGGVGRPELLQLAKLHITSHV